MCDIGRNTAVLIADDHSVVRMGLRFIIGHHFGKVDIFESEDCTQTVQQLQKRIFTHLVLDLQLKDGNGLDIFTHIRENYPNLHILIHSSSSEEVYGRMLMQRGAKGYLHKQSPDSELVKAFRLFFGGRRYISPAMEDILAETRTGAATDKNVSNPFLQLSARELAVCKHLLQGRNIKEIAYTMDLRPTTVATYKKRIFEKAGVETFIDMQHKAGLYNII